MAFWCGGLLLWPSGMLAFWYAGLLVCCLLLWPSGVVPSVMAFWPPRRPYQKAAFNQKATKPEGHNSRPQQKAITEGYPPEAGTPCCKACWVTTCNACWDSTPPAARHALIPPAMHAGIAPPVCCKECWDTICNACWDSTPLWTEWQTGANILPCPKLRLRAVIIEALTLDDSHSPQS